MMNKPELVATDIIPMINYAWSQSFVRVEKNLKAIRDRGWNPLNYALLADKQIQATMTDSEAQTHALMMKSAASNVTIQEQTLSYDSTINTTVETVSTLTNDPAIEVNYSTKYLERKMVPNTVTIASKLNYSSGRSAAVIETLLHDADLRKIREINKRKADEGKAAQEKLDAAKKLTAMLNFNTIGCRVGDDSLKVRMKIAQKKKDEENQLQQKKDMIMIQRKRKFDELQTQIETKNLPIEKLSMSQLKTLCSYKKRKGDISISKLKRDELLPLWLLWKDRPEAIEEAAVSVPAPSVPVPSKAIDDADECNHDSEMTTTIDGNRHTESEDNVMNITMI